MDGESSPAHATPPHSPSSATPLSPAHTTPPHSLSRAASSPCCSPVSNSFSQLSMDETMLKDDDDPLHERCQAMNSTMDDDTLFQPLYSGADITMCGAYSCIMQYASSKKLTYTAIDELLKLLCTLMPSPNLPSSFYKLKRFFQHFNMKFEHKAGGGSRRGFYLQECAQSEFYPLLKEPHPFACIINGCFSYRSKN